MFVRLKVILSFVFVLFAAFGCGKFQDSPEVGAQTREIRNGTSDSTINPTYPDVFALSQLNLFQCSSVAISPRLLLTAAHCVARFRGVPGNYSVRVGNQNITVSNVKIHPSFKFGDVIGTVDVAIIEMEDHGFDGFASVTGFNGRDFRRIYSGGDFSRGNTLVAVGFGENGGSNSILRRHGQVAFNEYVSASSRDGSSVSKGILELVPDPDNNTISCRGDSGGPTVQGSFVVGISSFVSFNSSYSCNAVHSAGYISTREFRAWIDETRRRQDPNNECKREGLFRSTDGGCKNSISGRVWSGQAHEARSWSNALQYCMNSEESGQTDWRLASPAELGEFVLSQGSNFVTIEGSIFWTSNSVNGSTGTAIDLGNGNMSSRSKSSQLNVLCVRG